MKKEKKITKIEFDLIENGLDFILSSLEPILNQKNDGQLKYSILHISAGVELILKERLRQEHWTLIFDNPNSANELDMLSGDFQSVSLETSLLRLENVCKIQFTDRERSSLKELKKKRNKIEHFQVNEIDAAIKSLVSRVLSAIFSFVTEHFYYKTFAPRTQGQIDDLRKKVKGFEEFTRLRLAQIKDELETAIENYEIVNCPKCYQETLPVSNELQCLFCGFTDSPHKVAELYVENIQGYSRYLELKDGGHFPLDQCPNCYDESVVEIGDHFYCFSCMEVWHRIQLAECSGCGNLYEPHDDDNDICDACESDRYTRWEKANP